MTDIIDFNKLNNGNQTFVECHCKPEGVLVTPIVLHDTHGVIITSLVCPECETTFDVINGFIQFEN